jgi:hypothetical protein
MQGPQRDKNGIYRDKMASEGTLNESKQPNYMT